MVDLLAEKVFDQLRVIAVVTTITLSPTRSGVCALAISIARSGPEHARDDELTVYQSLDLQNGFAVEKLVLTSTEARTASRELSSRLESILFSSSKRIRKIQRMKSIDRIMPITPSG